MESSHKTRKIIERCLLWSLFFLLGWAALTQGASKWVQTLAARQGTPLQLAVHTAPAMIFSYDATTHKVRVTVQETKCNHPAKQCFPNLKFFVPRQTERPLFWDDFMYSLATWRYNPLLILRTVWSYLTAWHERRTNLSPAEFIVLSLELSQLEKNDFSVKTPAASKKRNKRLSAAEPDGPPPVVADKAPLAVQDRPIVVEVLNASGKKGLALELTQYLRAQNEKGLLRVDVLQYDNYPSLQENSWLEDYSGRQIQLKQLGNAIGINGEIRVGTAPNVICDTRIILGQDFKMPF